MKTYIPNHQGFYPQHSGTHLQSLNRKDILDTVLFTLKRKIREVRKRCFINDVYESLERDESFHFGYSKKVLELINNNEELTSENVTLEHAIPNTRVIEEMRKKFPIKLDKLSAKIKLSEREKLLEFLKSHYYMCLITKKEDDDIRKEKLCRTMPSNWDFISGKWYARYKQARIEIKLCPSGQQIDDDQMDH
jgi:hypothetical protein